MSHNRIVVIAHRGASAVAPESTRAAFERAIAERADMIECDVQATRDARLIIFHDATLDRTTNGHGAVASTFYRKLARLDAGAWFHPSFTGERLLLVSHALRLTRGRCGLNLELKRTRRPGMLIERLVRVLRKAGAVSRVLISSFDLRLLGRLLRRSPTIAAAALCDRRPASTLRAAARLRCAAFHPRASLVTPQLVADAHAAGMRVHVWTVDSITDAARLAQMGVDGIMTNDPGRLRARALR